MTAGQEFVKWLRPFGCVVFLGMFVLFLVLCFTAGNNAPVKGYLPPHDTEYYSSHPDELCAELEDNLLPQLEGETECAVTGDEVTVTVDAEHFDSVKKALVHYYTDKLFVFEKK